MTSYEDNLKSLFDEMVMPILSEFRANVFSFVLVCILVFVVTSDIKRKWSYRYRFDGRWIFVLFCILFVTLRYRFSFKNKEDIDGAFVNADDKEVRRQNYLRYMYATQHVFSYKNDFSLIDFIYELEGTHPFWSPNYKAEIVSGLGKY